MTVNVPRLERVKQMMRYIHTHPHQTHTADSLAAALKTTTATVRGILYDPNYKQCFERSLTDRRAVMLSGKYPDDKRFELEPKQLVSTTGTPGRKYPGEHLSTVNMRTLKEFLSDEAMARFNTVSDTNMQLKTVTKAQKEDYYYLLNHAQAIVAIMQTLMSPAPRDKMESLVLGHEQWKLGQVVIEATNRYVAERKANAV